MHAWKNNWICFLCVCLLAACSQGAGDRPLTAATPSQVTETVLAQPPTPSASVTALPLTATSFPAYPAPGEGETAGLPSPTQTALNPAQPGGETVAAPPPPYPGPNQPAGATATALPPPYPQAPVPLTPTATPVAPGLPATTPTALPTLEPTPAPTATPTRTPVPRPTVVAAQIDLACMTEAGITNCRDPYLEMNFAYPAFWGAILHASLQPEAGARYTYEIQGSLHGEGRSGDFIPPLGSGLTAFSGFYSDLLPERCQQFSPAQICAEIQPEVILVLVFPEARAICDPVPGDVFSPLAVVAVNLPGHPVINGFVFYGDFLSPAQEAQLADYRVALLDPLEGRGCTNYLRSRFNVRMLEMVAGVRNDRLDLITAENVARWRALGETIQTGE